MNTWYYIISVFLLILFYYTIIYRKSYYSGEKYKIIIEFPFPEETYDIIKDWTIELKNDNQLIKREVFNDTSRKENNIYKVIDFDNVINNVSIYYTTYRNEKIKINDYIVKLEDFYIPQTNGFYNRLYYCDYKPIPTGKYTIDYNNKKIKYEVQRKVRNPLIMERGGCRFDKTKYDEIRDYGQPVYPNTHVFGNYDTVFDCLSLDNVSNYPPCPIDGGEVSGEIEIIIPTQNGGTPCQSQKKTCPDCTYSWQYTGRVDGEKKIYNNLQEAYISKNIYEDRMSVHIARKNNFGGIVGWTVTYYNNADEMIKYKLGEMHNIHYTGNQRQYKFEERQLYELMPVYNDENISELDCANANHPLPPNKWTDIPESSV